MTFGRRGFLIIGIQNVPMRTLTAINFSALFGVSFVPEKDRTRPVELPDLAVSPSESRYVFEQADDASEIANFPKRLLRPPRRFPSLNLGGRRRWVTPERCPRRSDRNAAPGVA